MFRSARIKLTCWYLLIIVLISFFFSAVIFKGVETELRNRFNNVEQQIKTLPGILLRTRIRVQNWSAIENILLEDLEAARHRVFINLVFANAAIIVISAIGGYFLAGKTLKPIEEMVKEQNRFVADASHELRTPLASLKTSTEVTLRNKKIDLNEARKILKSNLEDAASLQLLTDRLLSLAQYQKDRSNLIFEAVNIREVIENVYRRIDPIARKKNIEIKLDIRGDGLRADRLSLEEMIMIILDNSIKYTPPGGKVEVVSRTEGSNVIISVKDTGIGMDKKDIPHIFDGFYRVDRSRSKSGVTGFGLGLSIAKRIAGLHGGSIEVVSHKEKGSVFTIRLPIRHSQ